MINDRKLTKIMIFIYLNISIFESQYAAYRNESKSLPLFVIS